MNRKKIVCLVWAICIISFVTGCQKKEEKPKQTVAQPAYDTVAIHAGKTDVYLDEARYYAYTAQATYETYYLSEGKELDWNSQMLSGVTMQKGIKSMVLDDICYRECIYALAKEYNVTLSDSDKSEIENSVDTFFSQTNQRLLKKINITKKRLIFVFEKKKIAERIEEIMKASNKVSPESVYENWKKGNTVTAEKQWKMIDFKEPIFTLKDVKETLGSDS